jgi:hypothetical protein
MPRTDKSVTILTGMIIAALYVIMLVGFSRESYMRRDASALADAPPGFSLAGDTSLRLCRLERPVCPPFTPARTNAAPAEDPPEP